jgi:hypothetical protein
VGGELRLVPVDDIRYFLAEHKYVTVRYGQGAVLIEESLKSLEDEFAEEFLRIHRNALVATRYIAALDKERGGGHMPQTTRPGRNPGSQPPAFIERQKGDAGFMKGEFFVFGTVVRVP